MGCRLKCSKGTKAEDVIFLEFGDKELSVTDPDLDAFLSLEDVRNRLAAEGFIGTDEDGYIWRFVLPKVKPDEKGEVRYTDRILGTQTEEIYPAKKLIINSENEIIITNVDAVGRPDLIGFATDYFNNGKIKVFCRLRDYMEGDGEKNRGKFQPVMLTDVISTREEDDVNYKFVCVCCEDSVLEFPVESFGSVGIVIKAEVNNEVIYDSAVHWAPGDHDLDGRGSVNCIKRDGKTFDIVVKNLTKDTGVVPGTAIRYQKITIYTHDLLSWYDGNTDREITVEESRKNAPKPVRRMMLMAAPDSAKEQITIPVDSYDPGKIEQGAQVQFSCGKWRRRKVAEGILGSVSIYMFVFKTEEEAKKVIGRYNSLTESSQVNYWKRR